jgi:hypothetical protein
VVERHLRVLLAVRAEDVAHRARRQTSDAGGG